MMNEMGSGGGVAPTAPPENLSDISMTTDPPPVIGVDTTIAPIADKGTGYENAESADDLEDLERHHSLPNPEEIKIDHQPSQRGTGRGSTMSFWFMFLFMLVFILILSIGLAVGLTQRQKSTQPATGFIDPNNSDAGGFNPGSGSTGGTGGTGTGTTNNPPPSTPSQKDRRSLIKDYVIGQGISTASDFEKGDTPQSLALDFLAFIDQMNFNVPSTDKTTPQGYRFISRYIMSVVYYATSGPQNWEWDLNFMDPTLDICSWFTQSQLYGFEGVNCMKDGQMTMEIQSLRFVLNGLVGTLPKEIGELTTLTALGSIANFLSGKIPDEYEQLTNLSTLFLGLNLLTGPIPTWIASSQMSKLDFIYLSDNFLTGPLPAIESWNRQRRDLISVFAVDDNNLDGSLDLIWEFPNLLVGYLEENDFTGTMPNAITTTNPKLIELDVSENRVRGELSTDWYQLTDLEILDVHGNNLSNLIPSSQSTTPNPTSKLEFLALQSCKFNGQLPTSLGYDAPSLRHLDVSSNQFTGTIPAELVNLGQELTYLFLGDNKYDSGPIPSFIYNNLLNLRELGLKNSMRTGQIPADISQMSNLILLDLSSNDLAGNFPTEITTNLKNLQFLLLNDNNLDGPVPELGGMNKLQFVLVDKNSFTGNMDAICAASTLKIAVADCQAEVTCDCCEPCCVDGDADGKCHDYDLVDTIDWETNYERRFFNFGNGTDSIEVIPGAP